MKYRNVLAATAIMGMLAITGCSRGALPEHNEANYNGERLVRSVTRNADNNDRTGTHTRGFTRGLERNVHHERADYDGFRRDGATRDNLNRSFIDRDVINSDYTNRDFTNRDHTNRDHTNRDFMNRDHMNRDHMNRDYTNRDHTNRDYLNRNTTRARNPINRNTRGLNRSHTAERNRINDRILSEGRTTTHGAVTDNATNRYDDQRTLRAADRVNEGLMARQHNYPNVTMADYNQTVPVMAIDNDESSASRVTAFFNSRRNRTAPETQPAVPPATPDVQPAPAPSQETDREVVPEVPETPAPAAPATPSVRPVKQAPSVERLMK